MTETMTGAQWLAGSIAASGQTHVFFVDAVLRRTLLALGDAGVAPVLAHTEIHPRARIRTVGSL